MHDLDVVSKAAGLTSVLIVPCNMCPAVTVAVREQKPFIQLFKSFLKSSPFENYIKTLQRRLDEHGVKSKVFRSNFYHQWFMCMWTSRRRKKLQKRVKDFEAAIVLGCSSATETVKEVVRSTDCKVIEGMEVEGIMNAKLGFHPPGDVVFHDCRLFPISRRSEGGLVQRAGEPPAPRPPQ